MLSMVFVFAAVRAGNQVQFAEFARQVQWYQEKAQHMEEGVTPLHNILEMENDAPANDGRLPNPMAIVDRCRNSLGNFKNFVEEACSYVASHVLGVVRSHYPAVDMRRFAAGGGGWHHRSESYRAARRIQGGCRGHRWRHPSILGLWARKRNISRLLKTNCRCASCILCVLMNEALSAVFRMHGVFKSTRCLQAA